MQDGSEYSHESALRRIECLEKVVELLGNLILELATLDMARTMKRGLDRIKADLSRPL